MKTFTIASFNLRNNYWTRNWDGNEFPKELANFIIKNNIDFLSTQELVFKYSNKLQKYLGNNYSINGKYRYGKTPFISQINEANAIITNQKVLINNTKFLSKIPILDHLTLMPRIMTIIVTKDITIINTHLEYKYKYAQKHQLKILYKLIKKYSKKHQLPIITGDFNMDLSQKHFLKFIQKLKKIGINYARNNVPTYKTKEQILDHIFIPNQYELIEQKVITNQPINKISDHRPIIIKIRKKNT